jgi:lysophospholipase L1-like esterase
MLATLKTAFVISLACVLLSTKVFAANQDNATYLALGDSVAFGLNPLLLVSLTQPPPASKFIGYPEIVAAVVQPFAAKSQLNAACPGETSGSFISGAPPHFGCYSTGPQGQPAYKTWAGLHTSYSTSQLQFAVTELTTNKHINLVTLGIGSNDVFVLQRSCGTAPDRVACFGAGFPGLLQTYAGNLVQILSAIRATAGYHGKLVLVGYYSPSADLNQVAIALNSVTASVGGNFGAIYADGFKAFQLAAQPFGGDVCKAGLLIQLAPNTCDIHPSPKGRDILALTVLLALAGIH